MGSVFEYLKENKYEAVLFLVLFLVSTLSFGVGYLIAHQAEQAPIIIEKCSE